jgi:hypothetical protein
MAVSQLPQAPYRQDRKTFPTPIVGDVLFSEVRDGNRTNLPEYGTPHPNTTKWPNHKLVFIKPVDIERNEIFEFFYAADRENQDLYNFSVGYRNIIGNVGGREFRVIQRSYVTPREGFEPLDIAFGTPMPNIPEGKFDGVDYIFFDRQQQRIEQQELDSLYVAEVHTYVETAFLEYKLSYAADRVDPLPDRFRTSIQQEITEEIAEGLAEMPQLSGSELSKKEDQLNPDVKLIRTVSRATPTSGVKLDGVVYDNVTGRSLESDEVVYPRGTDVNGAGKVEDLFANPNNPFWGQQADGSFFIGDQISDDWFLLKKQFVAPTDAVNSLSNPAKKRFLQRVTPLGTDILFYEIGSMPTTTPTYGSAHYDVANWPNHKLIYIVPEGDSGILYRFYYAADRNNQDLYNFVDEDGRALTRTYIIPRAQYLNRASYNATIPTVGTSADPQFGSSDAVYGGFVFVGENIEKAPEPLDNLYVVIERVYLPKVRTSIKYDDNIEKSVSVTQTIIKKGTGPTVQNSVGVTVQVENVNNWYDIETVSRIVGLESMFDSNGKFIPIRLPDVPKDVNYNFPNKLNSVDIKFVTAIKFNSDRTDSSTDTAYYIDYDLQSPPTGPYAAKIIRFLTDDPQAIRAQYPVVQLHPKRETLGIATAIDGNANAQQIELPDSIHGPIDITVNDSDVDLTGLNYAVTPDLPVSADFFTLMAGGDFVAGYEVSKTILNLYEVSVVLINIDGLYTNKFTTSTTGQTRVRHVLSNLEPAWELVKNQTIYTGTYTRTIRDSYVYTQAAVTVSFSSPNGSPTITCPAFSKLVVSYSYTQSLVNGQWSGDDGSQYEQQAQVIGQNNHAILKSRPATFIASKLQKDSNLNPYFIFDSDGVALQATSIKSPAPTFGMTSSLGGTSVQVNVTI